VDEVEASTRPRTSLSFPHKIYVGEREEARCEDSDLRGNASGANNCSIKPSEPDLFNPLYLLIWCAAELADTSLP
jgi:hypothetical protein